MNGHDPLVKSTVAARGNSDGGYDTGNNQQHHHGTESHQASFRSCARQVQFDVRVSHRRLYVADAEHRLKGPFMLRSAAVRV
jgi:hypothetical protein